MASTTDTLARTVLDKETDARFWAATNYKVGQKLNASDPNDAKMAKVWMKIYATVKAENDAGHLVLTYTHPTVAAPLAAAASHDQDATVHLAQASSAPAGSPAQQQHTQAAAVSVAASQRSSATAAASQPPPAVAPIEVAQHVGTPARPPRGAPLGDRLAHAQAQAAASSTAAAHGNALPPDAGHGDVAIHPVDLAAAQLEARALAQSSPAAFVGVAKAPGGAAHVEPFGTYAQLIDWFDHGVSSRDARGSYLAAFNKHDASWPGPVSDGIGAEAALLVPEHADPSAPPPMITTQNAMPPPLPLVEVTMPGAGGPPQVFADPAPSPSPSPGGGGGLLGIVGGVLAGGALLAVALSGNRTQRHHRHAGMPGRPGISFQKAGR